MRKVFIQKSILLLLILSCTSCTGWIWENRDDCPCALTLALQRIPSGVGVMHLWVFGPDDRLLYRDTLERQSLGTDYTIRVKRDQIRYFIWGNIKEATELKDGATLDISLTKREGASADSLYFYSGNVDTRCESVTDTIVPGKEFATVQVAVKNCNRNAEELCLELLLNSSGFYVDRRFLSGQGSISAQPYLQEKRDALFAPRIARQASLREMRLVLTAYHRGMPVSVADYPLGEWMADHGYDMQAVNLSDVTLEIDLSVNFVTIQTEDWKSVFPVQIDF